MKKCFIDLGTHFGNGLASHIQHYKIDETWEIHTFEPNIYTFNELKNLRMTIKDPHSRYSWIHWNNIEYHNAAAWIFDGDIEFHCCTAENSNKMIGQKDFDEYLELCEKEVRDGISLKSIHDLNLPTNAGSTIVDPRLIDREGHNFIQKSLEFREKDKIKAPCIDFSKWIRSKFHDNDEVIIKVDIEGAEYFVLEKLIQDGIPPFIKNVNIEWHDWFIPGSTPSDSKIKLWQSKNFILNSFKAKNVHVEDWE